MRMRPLSIEHLGSYAPEKRMQQAGQSCGGSTRLFTALAGIHGWQCALPESMASAPQRINHRLRVLRLRMNM